MTLLRPKMIIAVAGRDGMDDMIYCSNNCGVARCLHHPSQIDNPETPHQFAHLHHTDYCPLWRQEVEKVEVVRCRDCKYCYSFITARSADGLTEHMEYRCKNFNASVMPDEYCSRGDRRDG